MLVIGLDCAEPSLVFERWRADLPNIARLMRQGSYRKMRSCDPPITVPAWSVMTSGKTPGELGVYGFRNRKSYNYDDKFVADGRAIKIPRLWDILTAAGKKSIVIGVPQTYPPKAINGYLVSGILTPPGAVNFTWPARLGRHIHKNYPHYQTDVPNFRQQNPASLLKQIYNMTSARFALARELIQKHAWDFFMLMEIGLDRMHHAFWQYMDPDSALFVPDSPFADAIFNYYKFLDAQIGELLPLCGDADVLIVSDHGAQAMRGLFRLNQWLIDEGYLYLKKPVVDGQALDMRQIDWTKTRVWADGGYYGRIYFNVNGREPQGIVQEKDIPGLKKKIKKQLTGVIRPGGTTRLNRVLDPLEIYPRLNGIAPDLMLYMEDLALRVSVSLGETLFIKENDTGPDGANHAYHGLCISSRMALPNPFSIYDVVPLVYKILVLEPNEHF